MDSVKILVPATTANLGPGYDCLGVAFQIYNHATITRSDATLASSPMAEEAAGHFFAQAGVEPFGFDWRVTGDVPRSRGLGSSVTVRLGLLHGMNELSGTPLNTSQLFEICAVLEGHPDNAAPATFGGFTVAGGSAVARFEVAPQLHFVLLVPDFEISTPEARRVLPTNIDRLGAVRSAGNACRITAAFATGDYSLLEGAFEDHLHQPYREKELIPFLQHVIAAGVKAGAIGGFLSGSGSTICCVTLHHPEAVAHAMHAASGHAARTIITTADNTGARVA